MGAFGDHIIRGLKNRWMMAVACFLILSFAGSNYIFSLYSQTIKINLGYDKEVIDTLAFFKDLGANVGIIAGLINEFCAPWVLLSMGSALNLTGYLMICLFVTGRVAKPAVWRMCMYQCLGGSSMTFVNTGIVVTCVKNFPRVRGLVIGLLKGFVGLSGAIITQIYRAVSKDEQPSFLLILADTLQVRVLLLMPIIGPMEAPKEKNETKNFNTFLVWALVLAGLLMAFILLENLLVLPLTVIQLFAAVTILIIFLPLLIVIRSELQKSENVLQLDHNDAFSSRRESEIELESCRKDINSASVDISAIVTEGTSAESSNELGLGTDDERKINKGKRPKRGEDHTIPQVLMSLALWILFLATTCGLGSTVTAIDNMGKIGKSLRYSSLSISTFVSLLSIWNFLGRVGAGFISEILLHKYSIPRPFLLSLVLLVASIGHLLVASGIPGSLYMASILIGMCFGAQWPLMFSVISELFGLRHFAILYNIGASASPLGAYLFSVSVAGYFYDQRAKLEVPSSDVAAASNEMICVGKSCFEITFIIMAAVSVVGSAIAAVLVYRTRQFYKQEIYGNSIERPMTRHCPTKSLMMY
eukprot:PITA_31851